VRRLLMRIRPEDLIDSPELVHELPDYELELHVREVVELLSSESKENTLSWKLQNKSKKSKKSKAKLKKSKKIAENVMRFIAAVYKRQPELCNAVVCTFAKTWCPPSATRSMS
jgi:hypothetical protein